MSDQIAFHLCEKNRTLLIGLERDNLLATQQKHVVAMIPFANIMARTGTNPRRIEKMAVTTLENFESIMAEDNLIEKYWDEFLDYIESKERLKEKSKIVDFPKE